MAEKSSFFNSISGDRTYRAEDWAAYFATFVSSGVVLREDAALAVTADAGSMSVTLGAGRALINGYRYENTAALSLALSTAHASLNRIDAVMIRWNRATRAIAACVVAGTPAAVPAAPAPTRGADVYDLCVAQVYVAAGATSIGQSRITDRRLDSDLCGIATMIGDLDTSTLYAQVQADLVEFQDGEKADFLAWFATAQNTLDEDAAGNLLNLIRYQSPVDYAFELPASGWSASAPYTQTVSVAGLLAADIPLVDAVLDSDADTARAQLEGYACVSRVETSDGQITATCLEDRPEADLRLTLRVIRGIDVGDASGETTITAGMVVATGGATVQEELDAHAALILDSVPYDTATGAAVEIEPIAGRPLDITVNAVAARAGSGDPGMDNRRTLSGHAAAVIGNGGAEYTLTPPTLLYGVEGAEDTVSNDGSVVHRTNYVTFTGTESWAMSSTNYQTATEVRFYRTPATAMADAARGVCDAFPWDGAIDLTPAVWGEKIGKLTTSANLQLIVLKSRLAGWSDAWTSTQKINAFKAFLAAQYALGTPVQLVYERAVPLLQSITPVAIPAAEGVNVIGADIGTVTVTYTAPVPEVVDAIRADIAGLRNELTGARADVAAAADGLDGTRTDLADVRAALSEVAAVDLDDPVSGYYIHYSTGVPTAYAGYSYVTLPCVAGETLYLTARVSGTGVALAVFYDAAMAFLGYALHGTSTAVIYTDEPTVVPAGAAYMRVTTTTAVPIVIKRTTLTVTAARLAAAEARLDDAENRLDTAEAFIADDLFDRASWRDRIADEQTKNDFRWATPFDRAYVTFTFDDCSDDVNLVADVFAAAGVPVCLSVPPSRLPAVTQSGETGLDVCRRVVGNGGEILAHSFSILTAASTDADYEAILVQTKRELAAAGLSVQGIIESGNGGDELTADFAKAVRYLRPYYRYSDHYGRGTGAEQYDNPRTYIKGTAGENHALVDTAVANHAWLIFASHRIDLAEPTSIGTTRAIVEDLLSYIAGLGAAVQVVTFAGMYARFRSSVLERAVAALEA